jgi:hypothetical protein
MEEVIKQIIVLAPEALQSKEPLEGHENRFLKKLSEASLAQAETEMNPAQTAQDLHEKTTLKNTTPKTALKLVWRKNTQRFLSVAASVAILFGVFQWGVHSQATQTKIASFAPEAAAINDYYPGLIANAVKEIEQQSSPLTKAHIDKAFKEISKLDARFKEMEVAMINGGNTKLILQAMVQNYTTRIELLEEVMHQINTINAINEHTDGNL